MAISLNLPETWNDLSDLQLENIAHQLFCYSLLKPKEPDEVSNVDAILYLNVAKELLRGNPRKTIQKILKEVRPHALSEFTEFIYKKINRTKFPKAFTLEKVKYYPPAHKLRNITIGEFAFADAAFYQFRKTQNKAWLSVLVASLYREEGCSVISADNRISFDKLLNDPRADLFHDNLSLKKRLSVLFAYEGCRNYISSSFPLLFPAPETDDENQVKSPPKYTSFREIILEKIEGDPAKFNQANNMLAYDFFDIVERDLKNLKKHRRWKK